MPAQPAIGSGNVIEFDVRNMDISEGGEPSKFVIEQGRPFQASVEFEFAGPWKDWFVGLNRIVDFTVKAESIGPEPELDLGTAPPVTTVAGTLIYTATLDVNPNPLITGIYRVIGAVTVQGSPPPPLAGYDEVPIIQIV